MTEMPSVTQRSEEAAPGATQFDARSAKFKDSDSLYRAREPVYPKLVRGKFRNIKWAVMIVALAVSFGLPWIRLDRGPGLPDQAFLLDFAHQRLYFFWLEIWAQEFYYVTGILVLSALALFLVTALAGRVWCGYACPQTVWTDLMVLAERFWQGDRNARIKLGKAPWSFNKLWRMAGTHLTWLLIAFSTGLAFIFYFRDAPTLASELWNGTAAPLAYIFIGIFTAFTYLLGGLAREQVCIYMCPWPRIQGAMFDADSLLITYRGFRGEPRGPHKKGQSWEGRGDCVDCGQCVAACPVGIDIRYGAQLECIGCALCIDACDEIMDKVGRPRKLIAYDSFRNLKAEFAWRPRSRPADPAPHHPVYGCICAGSHGHAVRADAQIGARRECGSRPQSALRAGERRRHPQRLHRAHHEQEVRRPQIRDRRHGPQGPEPSPMSASRQGEPPLDVKSDDVRAVKVYVTIPGEEAATLPAEVNIGFTVRDTVDGGVTTRNTTFRGPGQ